MLPKSTSKKELPTSPSPRKKQKTTTTSADGQRTLNSFFKSPTSGIGGSQPVAKGKVGKGKTVVKPPLGKNEIINLDLSSDESDVMYARAGPGPSTTSARSAGKDKASDTIEGDERLAREIAKEEGWELEDEDAPPKKSNIQTNGKRKASNSPPLSDQDDDIIMLSSASPEPKPAPSSSKKKPNPTNLASIFAPPKPKLPSPVKRDPSPLFSVAETKPILDVKPLGGPVMSLQNPLNASGSAKPEPGGETETIDFDIDPLVFRPELVALRMTPWPGGRLPYAVLVSVYVAVGSTRKRLAIVRILTNFLRLLIHSSPSDLLPTIYLLSNHLSPSYISLELGVGSQILSTAIKDVSGISAGRMKALWNKWGDPGDVAFEAKSNLRTLIPPPPLLAHQVYAKLVQIAKTKGTGSGKIKGEVVRKLLVQARGEEVRYLVRTLISHLRIGAVRLTLLSSLSRAFVLTQPASCTLSDSTNALHATREELDSVQPVPEKGRGKAKAVVDEVRERVEAKMVAGNALMRRVYVRHPNYESIMKALLSRGLEDLLERVPLSVGVPLQPMLGSITRSLPEVFTRLSSLPFTSEAKLDGQRVQCHARLDGPEEGGKDGGGKWVEGEGGQRVWVRLFSRHLEDMTEKYPDVCAMVLSILTRPLPTSPAAFSSSPDLTQPNPSMLNLLTADKITSFIMDGEIVAVDKDTGAYRTFQELSNRAKKDVKVEDVKVVVGMFAFDLMLLNDLPLLDQPFSIRRHLLRTLFPPFSQPSDPMLARFDHVASIDSTDPADVQAFFETCVSQKCEGLMVKLLESGEGLVGDDDEGSGGEGFEDEAEKGKAKAKEKGKGGRKKPLPSTYEPDARSQGWLKVKKDYLEGMGDSLDLVPIGAWWGQGRKAGWWSPILLALYNPETGALEAVCKCISGFTDAFYKDLIKRYPPEGLPEKCNKVSQLAYVETGGYRPDVWFAPSEVWEMRGADISLSPVYPAAATQLGGERGLSIRFPRFIKVREDKTWEEATTAAQFADMYRKQIAVAPQGTAELVGEMNEEEDLD